MLTSNAKLARRQRQIAFLQLEANCGLPDDYKSFLLHGTAVSLNTACVRVDAIKELVPLGLLRGFEETREELNPIALNRRIRLDAGVGDQPDELSPGFVAIGDDPGGNPFLLRTESSGELSAGVYYWDYNRDYATSDGDERRRLFRVADSFSAVFDAIIWFDLATAYSGGTEKLPRAEFGSVREGLVFALSGAEPKLLFGPSLLGCTASYVGDDWHLTVVGDDIYISLGPRAADALSSVRRVVVQLRLSDAERIGADSALEQLLGGRLRRASEPPW